MTMSTSTSTSLSGDAWAVEEVSFGCTRHDAPLCTLLRHRSTGEHMHVPGYAVCPEEAPVDAEVPTQR